MTYVVSGYNTPTGKKEFDTWYEAIEAGEELMKDPSVTVVEIHYLELMWGMNRAYWDSGAYIPHTKVDANDSTAPSAPTGSDREPRER